MLRKLHATVLIFILSFAALSAAPSAEEPSGPYKRLAMAGRGLIQILDVVGAFPGALGDVVAVGVTDQGMGDFYQVLDPDHGAKIRLGKSPGPEELAAADPDLVILRSYLADSLGSPLETLGVPVLYLDLETPEDFAADILNLGRTLDQVDRADELVRWFEERRSALESAASGIGGDSSTDDLPGVLLLQVSGSPDEPTISVSPGDWIQSRQIRLAGGRSLGTDAAVDAGWSEVNFEQIAAWDPEYIVLVSYRSDAGPYRVALENDPLWRELQAVKDRRIYAAPADFYSWMQADTRWILGAEWLARILNPDVIEAALGYGMEDSVREFFSYLYGIDAGKYRRDILPRISGDFVAR
jgi:iron complex transport system substrate-binding protein